MTECQVPIYEEILEPDLAICDSHHHLWHLPEGELPPYVARIPRHRYLLPEILADLGRGHNIATTIYANATAFYRADGPLEMRPVGETEFATGIAAMSASGRYGSSRLCSGIVAHADLTQPAVHAVLLEHRRAGGGRVKGIRHSGAYDPTGNAPASPGVTSEHLYLDRRFRDGFAMLHEFGYTFDAYLYHPQLSDLVDLARSFPQQTIILDHVGAPLGVGPYAGKRAEVFEVWRRSLAEVASCANVYVKLGGLGMAICGFDLRSRGAISSQVVAETWKPYIESCIALFGADRCLFESNFPVDEYSCGYAVLWNAFKRITRGYSGHEKAKLYMNSAHSIYGIGEFASPSGKRR